MNGLVSKGMLVMTAWGIGLHPGHLTAQVTDSLAYLELLHEHALPEYVLGSENTPGDGVGALRATRKAQEPTDPGALSWNAVLASSGRVAFNAAWSPHPWLEMAGSLLRESSEPVRLDPGAQWFFGEHASGYVRMGGRRLRLVLGDFRFRSAAALSTLGLRTAEPSRRHPWRPTLRMPDVRAYAGSSQQPAPRGMALSLKLAGGWTIDVFTSARREDGTVKSGSGTHPVQETSLRKSWHFTSASSLMSRRRVRVTAHGGAARMLRGPLRAGATWTRFSVPGGSRSVFESMGRWQWSTSGARTGFVATRFGMTPTDRALVSWAVEISIPVTDMALNLYHLHEQPVASLPWGPEAGMEPRDHTRRTTVASVGTRLTRGGAMVWGIRHHHRAPSRHRQSEGHQVAAWIHAERYTWALELRIRNEKDAMTGAWNGQARFSVRKETTVRPDVRITMQAVAAGAGGLGARVQWQASPRTRFVVGRTVIWGHDSDPWAVLVTDRTTGMLGLLRMTGPTLHWSIRLERNRSGLGRMTLFMDQRAQRASFTGTRDIRRRLVVALRY
ncbi:MAG: hypothetical protein RIE53_03040 [Rhodothermales bacterium]